MQSRHDCCARNGQMPAHTHETERGERERDRGGEGGSLRLLVLAFLIEKKIRKKINK